jgi:hypothetical protein
VIRYSILRSGDDTGVERGAGAPLSLKYRFTGYRTVLDPDGYP